MKKFLLSFLFLLAQLNFAQSDCASSIQICGNSSISYTPTGPGTPEPLSGCVATEHYSVWYTFQVATAGTLTMTITPNGTGSTDYDWTMFGPNVTCANLGQPIRCSYASTAQGILTGMNMTATDTTEGAGGDGWVQYMNVLPGQTYYLMVDNFSQNTNGFVLTWGGTATFTSPFNSTIQPNPFVYPGTNQNGHVLICSNPQFFNFSSLSAGILNGNQNFAVQYYLTANNAITGTNPITTPINVNTTTTYYYTISYSDPTNPTSTLNFCKEVKTINFDSGAITVTNATIKACNNNNLGTGTFNLTSATVYNGQATIQYYPSIGDANAGTNEITNPTAYVSQPGQVYALVTSPQGCKNIATLTLEFHPLPQLNTVTLMACNNNNSGVATYDLTTANVFADPNAPKTYYPTINDLLNHTNQITHPTNYTSAQGQVYVEVTNNLGCTNYGVINLTFFPNINTSDATLTECFLPGTPTKGEFDLTKANVTTTLPNTKQYYPSLQDAINNTNQITNPTTYIAPNSEVFVRVIDGNNCWKVAKITLVVTPPKFSPTLVDKTICIEKRTTLDAGPGFSGYMWSTGATSQVISNVMVGEYWVDLKTDGCITRQTVRVHASPKPVISNLEIGNNTITVTVVGGVAPYEFSLDAINWQQSNILKNVPRGQATIFVKDSFDCEPIVVAVTVPNLVNAITPNDDNVNDYLDYSALAYKKDLKITIFDRYGSPIHTADKKNNYRWDGRVGSNKLSTGNYWYTITWTEPGTDTQVKYSGWILVKNRD